MRMELVQAKEHTFTSNAGRDFKVFTDYVRAMVQQFCNKPYGLSCYNGLCCKKGCKKASSRWFESSHFAAKITPLQNLANGSEFKIFHLSM